MSGIVELEQDFETDLIETWFPRPDQPARFDQQESFYYSKHPGVTFLVGGNGAGTTETCMAKVAKFLLTEQEAPRRDTPFWIIAGSYEQCMEACWKEKLNPRGGHGHIPDAEIDWEKIRWYKTNEAWPFSVPLKPWPNGDRPNANWKLEFKSYKQGRAQMQARSIGGFAFVEQFPWDMLTEVLRGCREYGFSGAMLAEFTPIDPELSLNLQEMLEEDRLPHGWAVYRANTECALESGHVSQSWFDQFYGMIPKEMLQTRLTGAWGTYEGLIYQGFNPLIHFVGDDETFPSGDFPRGVYHRRGIDWGSGPENPFCCLFKYHNGMGEHFFYDEYYSKEPVTVGTHLKNVYDMWPWPTFNPYYGMTYADPSDPGNIRLAASLGSEYEGYGSINIQSANNRVLEGINYLRWLMQVNPATGRPRIFIHKKRCPNLAREIQLYRWLKGSANSINPRDAKPEPLKKDDHSCDSARYVLFSEARQKGMTAESVERPGAPARRNIRYRSR